jgi:hypothetical protein
MRLNHDKRVARLTPPEAARLTPPEAARLTPPEAPDGV